MFCFKWIPVKSFPSLRVGWATCGAMTATLGLLASAGCVNLPEPQAERMDEAVALPSTFQAEPELSLQIVRTLVEVFESDTLETLIEQALAHNPDLLASNAQLEEARFNLEKTRGGFWPSLGGNGKASRSGGNLLPTTERYELGLDAAWEVDVWGRIRNDVRASAADFARSEADYEASRQSLAGQVTQAWFDYLKSGQLYDLAQRRMESFESTRRMVERRYDSGTSELGDLELARTDAANARADLAASQDDQQRALRDLQILLGDYPDQSLVAQVAWPSLTRTVPVDLPSELLMARPDLVAAYEAILAADARVKVAQADLLPSFTLTGSMGRSSETLSDLGRSAFDVWSLAGELAAPLFEGGALRAELGAAGKRAEQAYQNYRAVALNAFLEVENALSSEALLVSEEIARLEALEAARRAELRARRDYEGGLSDILILLESQRRVFETEERTINLKAARYNNRVSLALALGKCV
ncbi:MAG: TolC family protein [Verrucomicrobiota bacterium]